MLAQIKTDHNEDLGPIVDLIVIKDHNDKSLYMDIEIQYLLVNALTDIPKDFEVLDPDAADIVTSAADIVSMFLFLCKITPNRNRPIKIKLPNVADIAIPLKNLLLVKGIDLI